MSAAEARQVLRSLLRAVDRNITSATGSKQWREFVIAQFRRGAAQGDSADREVALQEARDYVFVIESVREHKASRSAQHMGGGPSHLAGPPLPPPPCCRCLLACERELSDSLPSMPSFPQDLLLSYNIGIPIDQRERDMNARAAQLVGLQVPPKDDGQQ